MSEHLDATIPAGGSGVILHTEGSVHYADRDQWDPGQLPDRDLVVLTALVQHVAARLQHEQIRRHYPQRHITTTNGDPRP